MLFAAVVFPFIFLLASPRSMPPLNDISGFEHITSTSTSDYSAKRNHPTAYDDDPAFKGPLRLDDLGTPDAHRQRIRCHYLDDESLGQSLNYDGPPTLDKSTPTKTILKSIVDHLAQSDAPVDAKEVAESIEFYLRSGKRLLGAARRVLQNSGGQDSTIAVQDLCSGHGLTGMIFVACNPPGRAKGANVRAVLVDRIEPMSHSVLRDCISEVCPWAEESVQFESVPLEDFASRDGRDADEGASIVISTHACGSLTDKVLEYAMDISASAAAVMPCCYTGTDSGVPYGIRRMLGVGLAADVRRSFRLQENGYHVDFAAIPKAITPVNRLILAERRK